MSPSSSSSSSPPPPPPPSASVCVSDCEREALQERGIMDPRDMNHHRADCGWTQPLGAGSGPLKVSRDSHRIRKPPLPLPHVQYRPPIIIHTYSPKVIHTQPDDFMSLVQKLTGSSDTRLRLKKTRPANKHKSGDNLGDKSGDKLGDKSGDKSGVMKESKDVQLSAGDVVTNLERHGSGNSGCSVRTTSCGSPSSSEDSTFLVSTEPCDGEAAKVIKQSDSPRSPFDSNFEFDNVNEPMFDAHFGNNPFSQTVKAEPMFPFNETLNPFNFLADFMHGGLHGPVSKATTTAPLPVPSFVPRPHQESPSFPSGNIAVDHLPASSSFLSSSNNLMAGLTDFSWSQPNFLLDSLNAPSHFMNQAPYQRQRFSGPGYNSLSPDVGSTMVALDNIQAFMLT